MKHFLVLLETSKQITNKHPETTKNEWKDSHEVRGEEHCHENDESQATDLCIFYLLKITSLIQWTLAINLKYGHASAVGCLLAFKRKLIVRRRSRFNCMRLIGRDCLKPSIKFGGVSSGVSHAEQLSASCSSGLWPMRVRVSSWGRTLSCEMFPKQRPNKIVISRSELFFAVSNLFSFLRFTPQFHMTSVLNRRAKKKIHNVCEMWKRHQPGTMFYK